MAYYNNMKKEMQTKNWNNRRKKTMAKIVRNGNNVVIESDVRLDTVNAGDFECQIEPFLKDAGVDIPKQATKESLTALAFDAYKMRKEK